MASATNVRELRIFLDKIEEGWTEVDNKYLGRFEETPIVVPHFREGAFLGYGPAHIEYDVTGLGFIIDQQGPIDATMKQE